MKTRTLDLRKILAAGILLVATLFALASATAEAVASDARENGGEIAPLDPLAMKLAPGQWREYRFTGGATAGATVRWTWLEKEERGDETLQWFETRMEGNGQTLISRILGSIDDPVAPPVRVIMQTANMPPREMPEEMRQMAAPALKRNLLNPPELLTEKRIVEVPAGKFTTDVYVSNIGGDLARTYFSRDLPGMVSYEAVAGGMELIAFGDDGTTSVSGEIIPYTPLPPGVRPSPPGQKQPAQLQP
jgi:hypothetical protein